MNDVLQSAIQMKQAEADGRRPLFRRAPLYHQATLFQQDNITSLRNLPLKERVAEGQKMHAVAKEEMSAALAAEEGSPERRNHLHKAQQQYEAAYGLFVYMRPLSNQWKKDGVRDEHIAFEDSVSTASTLPVVEGEPEGLTNAVDFVVKTLCNLSICVKHNPALRDVALDALREANRRGPSNVRAAYLLAKLLQERAESTSNELDLAIQILRCALGSKPVRPPTSAEHIVAAETLLEELEGEMRRVSKHQSKIARRFLNKSSEAEAEPAVPPEVEVRPPPASPSSSVSTDGVGTMLLKGGWFEQAEQARYAVRRLQHEGRQKEASSLQRQLEEAAAEKLFVDFMRPKQCFDLITVASRQDAADLCAQLQIDPSTNPHVQEYLMERLRKHFEEDVPLQHLSILEVELLLFSKGLIHGTELNDLDAKNRYHAFFVTKTEGKGLVSAKPLLLGMDIKEIQSRERRLRLLLHRHLSSRKK